MKKVKKKPSENAEKGAQVSDQKWQSIVDAISDCVCLTDTHGKILECNKATSGLLGKPVNEIIGGTLWELMHGTTGPVEGCPIVRMKESHHRETLELSIGDKWLNVVADPIFDDKGNLAGAVHVISDITGRKQTAEKLRESEEQYRSLFENNKAVKLIIDPDSSAIVEANSAASAYYGWTREELLGKKISEINTLPPHEIEKEIDRAQREERNYLFFQHRLADGSIRDVEVFSGPIMLRGRQLLYSIIHDITERKKKERFIDDVFDSMGEGMVVIDQQFRIVSANRAYCEQQKEGLKDIIGRHCYEVSHHIDKPCHLAGEDCSPLHTFKTGRPHATIHTHHDKEGNPIYLETRSFPMRDASGKVYTVIETLNDITVKRILEDQLRHAQKMEAIGLLTGGVAHDFNNMLNVIIGYGTMLFDRLGDDQLSRDQMQQVLAAADRAATLTKRLLTFSRKQGLNVEPVDINEIILNMNKMLSRIIGEDIVLTMPLADRNLIVMADSGQIEQVLINLCSNARDAMPKGGRLMISSEIREIDEEFIAAYGYGMAGLYALISITDTGNGIDAETQKKIFDPFFTTKEVGKGTGLGLSISYEIIKQHNGYMKVYSEPGKGTTFKMFLPLTEETALKEQGARDIAPIKGGTETILVAEDDPSLRNLTRVVLESFGYTVIEAEDGEEAIVKFTDNRERIQLVILDVIMPRKSGKEAYDEINKIKPDIRALFLSGYTYDIIDKQELSGTGIDLINKPVSSKDLLKKVRGLLDG